MLAYCRVLLFQVFREGGGPRGGGTGYEEDEEVVNLDLVRQHIE